MPIDPPPPARSIAFHLSRVGLSGEVIADLVQSLGISDDFVGVLAAPELRLAGLEADRRRQSRRRSASPARSRRPSPARGKMIVIVNVGGHWVTVCAAPGYVVYADSYGTAPLRGDVRDFLRACSARYGGPVYFNRKRVQHPSSNYCGLFAALWALIFDGKTPPPTTSQQSDGRRRRRRRQRLGGSGARFIRFYSRANRLSDNDALCLEYLRRLSERGR